MIPPSFHDQEAVRTALGPVRGGQAALAGLVRALYRDHLPWDVALGQAPTEAARILGDQFVWATARVTDSVESAGTTKALWTAADGQRFESVLIRHPLGRTTLCLSSQVGCALRCAFCATGKLGLVRDLTVGEILDQAAWAVETLRTEGKTLRNVVFMGMGEPLLALGAVRPALRALLDQRRFGLAPRFVSVSTSGVTEAIEPFYTEFPQVKLAVSLHAPRQELRDHLMPGCRRWPLAGLLEALDGYASKTGHRLFFEYLMAAGVNDTDRELDELAALLKGRDAHVNLLPFNPISGSGWRPSDRETLDRFQRGLREAGVVSTVRYSTGGQIAASCGQLAGAEPGSPLS